MSDFLDDEKHQHTLTHVLTYFIEGESLCSVSWNRRQKCHRHGAAAYLKYMWFEGTLRERTGIPWWMSIWISQKGSNWVTRKHVSREPGSWHVGQHPFLQRASYSRSESLNTINIIWFINGLCYVRSSLRSVRLFVNPLHRFAVAREYSASETRHMCWWLYAVLDHVKFHFALDLELMVLRVRPDHAIYDAHIVSGNLA